MDENVKSIIEQLGDNEFLLPVGYVDSEDVLHRTVKLKPMTGETEEVMSNPKIRDNSGKVITELFYSVIEGIGTLKKVNKEVIRDLSTKDIDFLLIKNAQVSLGDEIDYQDKCRECGGVNEVNVNLAELEVKYLNADEPRELTFDLPNGYKDTAGKVHKTITVSLPNGRVQERIAPIMRSNPAQATTMLLQLCTKKLGDLEFLNSDIFKSMTKKDRDFIGTKIGELKIGVDFRFNAICSSCGEEFQTTIPFHALLGE